jgi:hypothetical protein
VSRGTDELGRLRPCGHHSGSGCRAGGDEIYGPWLANVTCGSCSDGSLGFRTPELGSIDAVASDLIVLCMRDALLVHLTKDIVRIGSLFDTSQRGIKFGVERLAHHH